MAYRALLAVLMILLLSASSALGSAADSPRPPPPALTEKEIVLLARTAYWEARSDGGRGMLAVAFVVLNRLRQAPEYFGDTVAKVVYMPWQFSVWAPKDRQRARDRTLTAADPSFALALKVARLAASGAVRDPTKGSTYFYAGWMKRPPRWARGLTVKARIGSHIYLAPKGPVS